jgi:predicted flap endonuclease-1-like 5' DNA nuclease
MTNEFLATYWPIILGGLIALAALVLLLTRRRQHVEIGTIDPVIAPTLARASPVDTPAAIDADSAEPSPVQSASGDDLRRIKGLGPKVAARLGELGVSRLDQLASLDTDAQAALDAQLGTFAGRMARDRWVEQAGLLARNDIIAFEEQFGKLG